MKTFEPKESEIAARELLKQLRTGSFEDWIDRTAKAFNQYANQQNTAIAAELAQVRKEREWVSVNEPPKIGERVLLLVECIGESYVAIGHRKADNLYYKDKGTLSKPMETICKWMPLPAAPDNIK